MLRCCWSTVGGVALDTNTCPTLALAHNLQLSYFCTSYMMISHHIIVYRGQSGQLLVNVIVVLVLGVKSVFYRLFFSFCFNIGRLDLVILVDWILD